MAKEELMRKMTLVFALLVLMAGGLAAQQGFLSVNAVMPIESYANSLEKTQVTSIGGDLSAMVRYFTTKFFVNFDIAGGFPIAASNTYGGATQEIDLSDYSTKMNLSFMLSGGYLLFSSPVELSALLGLGFNVTDIRSSTLIASYWTDSIGASLTLVGAYPFNDRIALTASLRAYYGFINIRFNQLVSDFIFTPSVGMRIKIRE